MAISTVRRLAADIFHVGENKIRISPDGLKDAEGALTRTDVKSLIAKGIITKLKPLGRASTKKRQRRGPGHRKGISLTSKEVWMTKVRAQRRFLKMLVTSGAIKKEIKRALYGKIKSGIFKNKRAMLLYLKDNALVAKDYEPPKPEFKNVNKEPEKATPRKQIENKGDHKSPDHKAEHKTEGHKPHTSEQKKPSEVKVHSVEPHSEHKHEQPPAAHHKNTQHTPGEKQEHEKKGESK